VLLSSSGCTFIAEADPSNHLGLPTGAPVASSPGPSLLRASPSTPVTISPAPTTQPTIVPTAAPPTDAPATGAPASPKPTKSPGNGSGTKAGFKPGKIKLKLQQIADLGNVNPVYVTGDGTGDGLLYVVERAGRIRMMTEQGQMKGTLLDLRGKVGTDGERGMHAVAFHPDFQKNGKFYVHYNTPAGNTRVIEYQQKQRGQQVAAGSGRTIFDFSRPEWNHNGGWLGFGPDGYLYIALGDGGGNSPGDPFGNGQDKNDLFGNILRINVDKGSPYSIPKGNPFAKGGGRKEIWSYGLRNPWRASFDSKTGNLWIGDVGQDQVEEVDIQPRGKGGLNFGWSVLEGSRCHKKPNCSTKGLTLPVTEYTHTPGCSVIGGYVYRGTAQPLLDGAYLFSDFCSKSIYAIDASTAKAGAKLKPRRLLTKGDSLFVSLGQGDDGELYIVSFGGGIYHIVARPK
jgi:glucose/arabinose dehydrogenase